MKEVMANMCVNRGERVVEENDLARFVVCGPGETDTLPLTAGEGNAFFADLGSA